MILDQQSVNVEGVMPGPPDFPFAALPRQPSDVKEIVNVTGVNAGSNVIAVTGSVDD